MKKFLLWGWFVGLLALLWGCEGVQGEDGRDGLQGEQGESGRDGLQGPQGPQGGQGPQGEPAPIPDSQDLARIVLEDEGFRRELAGALASDPEFQAALRGPAGPQGERGPEGPAGPQGERGPAGEGGGGERVWTQHLIGRAGESYTGGNPSLSPSRTVIYQPEEIGATIKLEWRDVVYGQCVFDIAVNNNVVDTIYFISGSYQTGTFDFIFPASEDVMVISLRVTGAPNGGPTPCSIGGYQTNAYFVIEEL